MNIWKSLGSASVCALGLIAVTPAMAEPMLADAAQPTVVVAGSDQSHITLQKQVRFGDLDLTSDEGRARLDKRVRFAASDVCDGQNVMNTQSPFDYLRCYKIAMQDVRAQLGQRMAMAQGGGSTAVR